jgi:hypothetical protein
VRALMSVRAAISGLVRPSGAIRAICASCAVSSCSSMATLRLRAASPMAFSSRPARSAKASIPVVWNILNSAVRSRENRHPLKRKPSRRVHHRRDHPTAYGEW